MGVGVQSSQAVLCMARFEVVVATSFPSLLSSRSSNSVVSIVRWSLVSVEALDACMQNGSVER